MIKEITFGTAEYAALLELRRKVLRRPLGLEFSPSELARDPWVSHFGLFEEGRVVGGFLLEGGGTGNWVLRQMVIDPEGQGAGRGRELLEFAESWLRERSVPGLELHARVSVKGFYERCGYVADGPVFNAVGMPHQRMEKLFQVNTLMRPPGKKINDRSPY
jgi:GNAT superfamily N-acetyltransferase